MSGLLHRVADRAPLDRLWAVLPRARLVGGAVRDLLCGLPPLDLDLATPEPPDRVAVLLAPAGIKVVPTGIDHGTVTAVLDGRGFEITTLRRDVATDGRHAVVDWTTDWREDAARRDFTINAMSLDRNDGLHDFFGGARDLADGVVRFVGDPVRRLEEDALRGLRFFRFHARFGRGDADPRALAAIAAAAPGLGQLSAERVWSELKRLLTASSPSGSIRLMAELGVLRVVLPGGSDAARFERLLRLGAPADAILRLAALSTAAPAAVAARLRLSRAEGAVLESCVAGPVVRPELSDVAIRRVLLAEPAAAAVRRSWMIQAEAGTDDDPAGWDGFRERLMSMPRPVFPLSGADAVAAGMAPGPAVGRALRAVAAWWEDGGCEADRAACLARLREEGGG
ncbi:MAG: CCA tRNA nucleotidyltransferase [Gluconacetobacter diazotrophicus]|nr:CCA tRNA nucleotidyltransferase [Gluconacetobacter diazotrophicus]